MTRGLAMLRPLRRLTVSLHIAVSVSWLGTALCLLVLGITARLTRDPAEAATAYRAMAVLTDTLGTPVSLISLLSGLALAVGRPWGLTRHLWIVVKLALTLAAVPLTILALPDLIAGATTGPAVDLPTANNLVIAPAVAVTTYTALVVISVLKPWGLTRGRAGRFRATHRSTAPD